MSASSSATPTTSISLTDMLSRESAEALAGLLDTPPPADGDPLPSLWHWVYFLNRSPQRDLGPDGHPIHGVPAPPQPGMLRMFAGGRVWTHAPLSFGIPAKQTTSIAGSVKKIGTSGPLRFVTVRSTITQRNREAIVEERDIVYRTPGPPSASHANPVIIGDVTQPLSDGLTLVTDPVLLFRFSALTYNAHRIHYDAPYAALEGYPGLVVHGPLQALLMGEHIRRSGTSFVGRSFSYRLLAPTFSGERLSASAKHEGSQTTAHVQDTCRTTATGTLSAIQPAPQGKTR